MSKKNSPSRNRRDHNILEYFLYLLAGGALSTLFFSLFLWVRF